MGGCHRGVAVFATDKVRQRLRWSTTLRLGMFTSSPGNGSTATPRVGHDVAGELEQIGVGIVQDRLVAPLEQMATAPVAAIARLSECAVHCRMPCDRLSSGVSIGSW